MKFIIYALIIIIGGLIGGIIFQGCQKHKEAKDAQSREAALMLKLDAALAYHCDTVFDTAWYTKVVYKRGAVKDSIVYVSTHTDPPGPFSCIDTVRFDEVNIGYKATGTGILDQLELSYQLMRPKVITVTEKLPPDPPKPPTKGLVFATYGYNQAFGIGAGYRVYKNAYLIGNVNTSMRPNVTTSATAGILVTF